MMSRCALAFLILGVLPGLARADVAYDMIQLYGHALKTCLAEARPDSDLVECRGKLADDCQRSEMYGHSTFGTIRCSFAESRVWMDLVNESFEVLRQRADLADTDQRRNPYAPKLYISRVESLDTSQEAWRNYRNTQCRFARLIWGTGRLAEAEEALCRMQMAQKRAGELHIFQFKLR
ncbi:MAG: lysozyme inhibitor LprI family protein [Pseudomonadota bacterium]